MLQKNIITRSVALDRISFILVMSSIFPFDFLQKKKIVDLVHSFCNYVNGRMYLMTLSMPNFCPKLHFSTHIVIIIQYYFYI